MWIGFIRRQVRFFFFFEKDRCLKLQQITQQVKDLKLSEKIDPIYSRLQGPCLGVPHHSYVITRPYYQSVGNEHVVTVLAALGCRLPGMSYYRHRGF